jgi:two-component system, sensor histidine kinase and response regulator
MKLNNALVLLVDDNLNNLQLLGKVLREEGFSLNLAQDGQSALNALFMQTPDIILLDIMMPEMNGYEVCQRIKSNDKYKEIPVIFLTAKNQTEDLVKGFEAGGVDYIVKPFIREELLIRLKTHLELAASKRQILELNRTRDKLYSIIAHDIRSPLNSIVLTVEALTSGALKPSTDDFKEIMDYLDKEVRSTSNLLNNLLEWTKLQSGTLKLNPISSNIHILLEDCVDLMLPLAAKKNIKIVLNVPDETYGLFDEVTTHTIFRNLISNATKFTSEGGIISLTLIPDDNNLIINVKDTGVGMSKEIQEKIFEKRESYSTTGTQKERGSGLGLMVVKEFIEKNNGKIEVLSEIGKGTSFVVYLPLPAFNQLSGGEMVNLNSIQSND